MLRRYKLVVFATIQQNFENTTVTPILPATSLTVRRHGSWTAVAAVHALLLLQRAWRRRGQVEQVEEVAASVTHRVAPLPLLSELRLQLLHLPLLALQRPRQL